MTIYPGDFFLRANYLFSDEFAQTTPDQKHRYGTFRACYAFSDIQILIRMYHGFIDARYILSVFPVPQKNLTGGCSAGNIRKMTTIL